VELGSSSEFVRVCAARGLSPLLPTGHKGEWAGAFQTTGSASPGILSPTDTSTSGAPCRQSGSWAAVLVGEGRQALTGAVLRVLAPLDGSGCDHGSCEPLAEPVVFRGAPALRGLVPCRSRPWSRPSELSPLEEPYPLSRAFASLWVRVRPPPARRPPSTSVAFPLEPTLCRGSPEGSPDAWAGRQGSPHRRDWSVVPAEASRPQPLPLEDRRARR